MPGTNGSGSKITITSTATSLQDLVRTASGDNTFEITDEDALDIFVESNEFRWFDDNNIPTSSLGNLAVAGDILSLRGVVVKKMQLIRSGASDCVATTRVGFTNTR